MKRILFIIIAAFLLANTADAQVQTVLDGAYVKEHNATKRVIPYPHLREADVMWSKRIWRVVDLREKLNHPFYYPKEDIEDRRSLFNVIKHALLVEGSLTAYGLGPTDDDDEFRYALSPTEIDSVLNQKVTRRRQNLDTEEWEEVETIEPIESRAITQNMLKEDSIFDKKRSESYVRII